jgi:putative Ca2+/H+ antiporter (TMEM165/GDT1 family)
VGLQRERRIGLMISHFDVLLQSFGLVVASEFGDKTQLLALVLALRFRRPLPVLGGILVATLLNHGIASVLGGWIGSQIPPNILRLVVGGLFLAFAVWILVPDKLDDSAQTSRGHASAFWATTVLFFLAEMGDKTQLATVALGARFQMPVIVTIGTTLGMLVADGLAVLFGERFTHAVPLKVVRIFSALMFAGFGAMMFLGW